VLFRSGEDLAPWVGRVAAELRVSEPALQWRLYNLGLITRPQMDAAAEVLRRASRPREKEPPLFGRRFVERVSAAVEDGRLSMRRAASLLGLSLKELADVCAVHGHPLSYTLPG
jgi:hypothetical protein